MPRSAPRSSRAPVVAGALLVVAAGVLSGCATGFEAGTVEVYTAPAGSDLRDADVDVLGALIVADETGSSGTLVAGLVAGPDSADTLTAVQFADEQDTPFESTVAGGRLDIPAGELVQTADGPAVSVSGELVPGQLVTVAFTFERSGPVSGELLVVPQEGSYAEVPIAEVVPRQAPPTDAPPE